MRRRNFIMLLGGAAAWPIVVHAQQPERMRRIGILMYLASDDAAFVTGETLRVDGGMTAHSPSYGAD